MIFKFIGAVIRSARYGTKDIKFKSKKTNENIKYKKITKKC